MTPSCQGGAGIRYRRPGYLPRAGQQRQPYSIAGQDVYKGDIHPLGETSMLLDFPDQGEHSGCMDIVTQQYRMGIPH